MLGPSPVSRLLGNEKINVGNTIDTAGRMERWVGMMQLPLKPTGQRLGRRVDFFEAALLTTVFTVVVPALVSLGLLGRFVIGKMGGGLGAIRL